VTLASALSFYLNLNLLVAIGFCGLILTFAVLKLVRLRLSSNDELRLQYAVLFCVLAFSMVQPFLPRSEIFQPAAKVWSAQSLKSFSEEYKTSDRAGYLSLPTFSGPSLVKANSFSVGWLLIGFGTLLLGCLYLFRDLRSLLAIKRRSYLTKKVGRVRIFINEEIQVPFSYWLPREANVVIPATLLARPIDLKIAVSHELQHHRSGDTRWVYLLWGLRLVCVLNPAIYFWNRWIQEIQEFACDETLIGRRRVNSQAYARCLFEVAQTAIVQKRAPVCATGLTFLTGRNLLKRRIERMFSTSANKIDHFIGRSRGRALAMAFSIGMFVVVMGAAAYASKGIVQDRRVSLSQAKSMALRAQIGTGMPIVVNDLVLRQLNRFIGTPEGREYMRSALTRLANHKVMVTEALEKYQVPLEVLALPVIESGYQNLAQGAVSQSNLSAGIWQFIPQTARNYGLRVDAQKDERMDTSMLTDAAMRYLQANNLRFKDWQLALMAYNMGENAVQKAMVDLDTRDAWTLIRNGREGDKDYLAKFMAAVLIMRNPDSVE
jgi:membrane-bound lytic murein transglycosylase D